MKKLMAALAAMTLAVPVMAEPEIKEWNTYHSMGCMLLRECKEGVVRIETVDDVLAELSDLNLDNVREEMTDLLAVFEELGIEVYVADDKYFVSRTRGIYTTEGNKFFLNRKYMTDGDVLLSVSHATKDGTPHRTVWQALFRTQSHCSYSSRWLHPKRSYRIRADIAYGGGHCCALGNGSNVGC